MKTKILIYVVLRAVILVIAEAQQLKKVPRIGFLAGGSRAADSLLLEAFWRRMNELGYIERKNIAAEYRFAKGAPERLPNFAEELVRLNVDVIVGPGSGVRAAKNATNTIPIVITYTGDPVGSRLVPSPFAPWWKRHRAVWVRFRVGRKNVGTAQKKQFPGSPVWRFSWGPVETKLFLREMKVAAVALQRDTSIPGTARHR